MKVFLINKDDHLKETDQLDQMQIQKQNEKEEVLPNSQNKKEESKARRTITVVEHENGFLSKGLKIKPSDPSSSDSNKNIEQLQSSTDKGSLQGVSEKSKPLSPNSSQQLSPNEGGPFDYQTKKISSDLSNSKGK